MPAFTGGDAESPRSISIGLTETDSAAPVVSIAWTAEGLSTEGFPVVTPRVDSARTGTGGCPLAASDKPSVAVAARNAAKTGDKRILFRLVDTSTHHALSKAGPTKQQ